MKLNHLPYSRYLLPTSFIVMLLVSGFIISSMVNFTAAEVNTTGTYFKVSPVHSTADNGTTFTIDIYVMGAPANTHDWQVMLSWNTSVLDITAVGAGDLVNASSVYYESPSIANIQGSDTIGQSLKAANVTSGDQRLCSATFLVKTMGSSALGLSDTYLINLAGVKTYYPNNDGFFRETTVSVNDVAITSITLSTNIVIPAGSVSVTVNSTNEGNIGAETFDVQVYADVVTHNASDLDQVMVGDEVSIANYTVTGLGLGLNNTWTGSWTPGGNATELYYISAKAILGTDNDPHDNILIDGTVKINVTHDLKISSLSVPSEVYSRDIVPINFIVVNQGSTNPEANFYVTITANVTEAGKVLVSGLASWTSVAETFLWDTSNITKWLRGTYTINVSVPDLGERAEDLPDNSLTATILVKPVHDIKVSSVDIPSGLTMPPLTWNVTNKVTINVYLANEGTENETFQLYMYADGTQISYNASIFVAQGKIFKHIFKWDTTGTGNGTYYISAYVPQLPGERPVDVADNVAQATATVTIRVIPGDINYDGWVDWKDLLLILVPNYNLSVPPQAPGT